MKWHPHARLVLEVALLELMEERPAVSEMRPAVAVAKRETISEVRQASAPRITPDETPIATDKRITQVKSRWNDILEGVKKKSIFGYVSLHEGEPAEVNDQGKLVIAFRRGYAFHKERLEEPKNKQAVEETLREVIGEKLPIECVVVEGKKEPTLSASAVAEFFEGRVL
jgi:DNA polymerase-3 subunit gamma/tau